MAQTERDLATIQTSLADNVSGAITPEDVRDAVASVGGGYAGLLLTSAGAPQVLAGVAQTPLAITQYDVRSAQSADVNDDGSAADAGTGIITVNAAGLYHVDFFTSFSLNANNRTVTFRSFLNGSPGLIELERFVSTGADVGEMAASGIVPLAAGDEIEIRVSQSSGSADVSFIALGFNLFRVG